MDNQPVVLLEQPHKSWSGPIAAAVCLPLLFIIIMAVFPAIGMPQSSPLGPVVGAVVAAFLLSRLEPSMTWRNMSFVTFWFILAAAVGGISILLAGIMGLNALAAGGIGLAVMVLIQGGQVLWQFRRTRYDG